MTRFRDRTQAQAAGSAPSLRRRPGPGFEDLHRRHASAAWGVAYVILRHPDDAADAVSEASARVYRAWLADPELDFRPYLLAAVRNTAIDIIRRRRRLEPVPEVTALPGLGTDSEGEPLERVVDEEDRAYAARAFASLPERWRSALWLIDVEEVSTEEAGTVLGVTANTAAQLASRGRSRLRQEFLQAHVPNHVQPGCRAVVDCLGAYAAGTVPPGRRRRVETHLSSCGECEARVAELDELGLRLRRALPPVPLALLQWRPPGRRGRLGGLWDHLHSYAGAFVPEAAAGLPLASGAIDRLVAGASAAALVVGVSALALRGPGPGSDGGTPPAVAAAAATGSPTPGSAARGLPVPTGAAAGAGPGPAGTAHAAGASADSPAGGSTPTPGTGSLPGLSLTAPLQAGASLPVAGPVLAPLVEAAGPVAASVVDSAAGLLSSAAGSLPAGEALPIGDLAPVAGAVVGVVPATVSGAPAPTSPLSPLSSLGPSAAPPTAGPRGQAGPADPEPGGAPPSVPIPAAANGVDPNPPSAPAGAGSPLSAGVPPINGGKG